MTLQQLINDALTLIDEYANSQIADLPSGGGNGTAVATTAQITTYLGDAAAALSRLCWRYDATGTFAVASATRRFPWASPSWTLTDDFGSTPTALRAAVNVLWTAGASTTPLLETSEQDLRLWFPAYGSEPAGTPLYFFRTGESGVGVYPQAQSGGTLTVEGLGLPPALPSGGPAWLAPDLHRLLSVYAALQVATKALSDSSMPDRIAPLEQKWQSGVMAQYEKLKAVDPQLALAHFTPQGQ